MNDKKQRWVLNVPQEKLTLQERKDAMIMLGMLNVCGEYSIAITKVKELWVNSILPLLPTNDQGYNARKVARHLAMKRLKNAYYFHITQA